MKAGQQGVNDHPLMCLIRRMPVLRRIKALAIFHSSSVFVEEELIVFYWLSRQAFVDRAPEEDNAPDKGDFF